MKVIGRVLWAQGGSEGELYYTSLDWKDGGTSALEWALRNRKGSPRKRAKTDAPIGVSDQSWRVTCDLTGEVTGYTGYRNRDGAIAMNVTPFDIWLVFKIIVVAGGALMTALSIASRRASQEAGASGARLLVAGVAEQVTARPVGRISVAEMEQYLTRLLDRVELKTLANARALQGEALKRETLTALHQWETSYGRSVRFARDGEVARLTGRPRNLMSLQGTELLIETPVLANPTEFYSEVIHEMAADALGVRGTFGEAELAFIGHEFSQHTNALFILENAIKRSLGQILAALSGGDREKRGTKLRDILAL